ATFLPYPTLFRSASGAFFIRGGRLANRPTDDVSILCDGVHRWNTIGVIYKATRIKTSIYDTCQLLQQLDVLHKMGYVFGDLKNDNILINTKDKPTVRLIDVGGVTKMGQSIKEYSNFFDRGYWQLGTRRAQPSYDLFALVMIVLTIYYPKQFKRGKHPRQQLIKAVQSI